MERVILSRAPDSETPQPGEWSLWDGHVTICCPQCRELSALEHRVDEDGDVQPSVVDTCGWHVWVRLRDYDPADLDSDED